MPPVAQEDTTPDPASQSQAASPARTSVAVILAGRLRESPLRQSLNVHGLCLPVGHAGTLLEAWLDLLKAVAGLEGVRVVVNTAEDALAVRSALPREHRIGTGGTSRADAPRAMPVVEVMAEPRAWRGPGGIVRDVTEGLADDAIVLVCEGMRLPPVSLDPLLQAMSSDDASTAPAGAVAVCGVDEPAGVYAFTRRVIKAVPRVGYFDMKEQLLPALSRENERVVTAPLPGDPWRLRDLESYLESVRHSLTNGSSNGQSPLRVSARASVSGSAVLDGFCIIEPGAVIEDGAVVHDSVVLWGATVGGGAVVSRSVVGPLAGIEPRARIIHDVVARMGSNHRGE